MEKQTTTPIELTGFRHPITGQVLMMTPDDATAYLKFTRAFREQFRPVHILEEQLAQSLADAQWRMNHARALENNIFSTDAAAYAHTVLTNEPQAHAAAVNARRGANGPAAAIAFSTYEQRLNRQFHQNLKLLRELQAERRLQEEADLDRAAQFLEMEKAKTSPSHPLTYSPADDGFVFSIPQIEAHLRLRNRRRQAAQFHFTRSAAA